MIPLELDSTGLLSAFFAGELCIQVESQEEYDEMMNICKSQGVDPFKYNNFLAYKNNTYLRVDTLGGRDLRYGDTTRRPNRYIPLVSFGSIFAGDLPPLPSFDDLF